MALLDWMSDGGTGWVRGDGVRLRSPRPSDYEAWSALRYDSRRYLQPWEPRWPEDDLSKAAFKRRLSIYQRETELGTALPMFVFDAAGHELFGAVTLSNVRRGVAETGTRVTGSASPSPGAATPPRRSAPWRATRFHV